jgi:hypothetical protein
MSTAWKDFGQKEQPALFLKLQSVSLLKEENT